MVQDLGSSKPKQEGQLDILTKESQCDLLSGKVKDNTMNSNKNATI